MFLLYGQKARLWRKNAKNAKFFGCTEKISLKSCNFLLIFQCLSIWKCMYHKSILKSYYFMKFLRKNSKKSWPIDNVWKNLSGCTDFQISYFFQIFSNFGQKSDTLRHTNALYQWKYILEVGISQKNGRKPPKTQNLGIRAKTTRKWRKIMT